MDNSHVENSGVLNDLGVPRGMPAALLERRYMPCLWHILRARGGDRGSYGDSRWWVTHFRHHDFHHPDISGYAMTICHDMSYMSWYDRTCHASVLFLPGTTTSWNLDISQGRLHLTERMRCSGWMRSSKMKKKGAPRVKLHVSKDLNRFGRFYF